MEARPRVVINYQTAEGKEPFRIWFRDLNDAKGKKAIIDRLLRAERGTLGHCDDAGEGVWGFKIDVGPGYRVYFGQDGPVIVILLCGGEKHGQERDMAIARFFWRDHKSRKLERREK